MEHRLRVAIIGGGIAGLVLALALFRSTDIELHIYEAAHQFSEIGAGIGMFTRVWKIICAMGFDQDVAAASNIFGAVDEETELLMIRLRKSDQPEGINYYDLRGRGELSGTNAPRAILKRLPASCATHVNKRLVSLDEPSNLEDPIILHFQDGTTAPCDFLIGADGIKSAVRAEMLNKQIHTLTTEGNHEKAALLQRQIYPMWSGTLSYRGLIPKDFLMQRIPDLDLNLFNSPSIWAGKNKHIGMYPVSQGKLINVVASVSYPELEGTELDGPMMASATAEEVVSAFSESEKAAQDILRCLDKPSRWALCAIRHLDSYISEGGRVALIGDAAHAMTPHQGSGAGQAIEDAYILSCLFAHPGRTRQTIPEIFKIYDQIRRPFSQGIWERSRKNGLLYQFNWPGHTDKDVARRAEDNTEYVDKEALVSQGKALEENMGWMWASTIDEDQVKAMMLFEQYLQNNTL